MEKICNQRIIHLDICLDTVPDDRLIQIHLKRDSRDEKSEIQLLEWIEKKQEECRRAAEATGKSRRTAYGFSTLKAHLTAFLSEKGDDPVYLTSVDKAFCLSFVAYLRTARNLRIGSGKGGRQLSVNTQFRIFNLFVSLLNKAVRSGFLLSNPVEQLERSERPRPVLAPRSYLTLDEVRALSVCRTGPKRVRNAFLFSCFCGLRWSDVKSLKWNEIKMEAEHWVIAKRMVKTGEWIHMPLNEKACSCLPPTREGNLVFNLPSSPAANADLKRWVKAAGIDKRVTFHTARHTFATLLLSLGADLYTTSKLMGHASITTTQIYAEVVDENKKRAVSLMDGIL